MWRALVVLVTSAALLAPPLAAAATRAGPSSLEDDASVLRRFRASIAAADPGWTAGAQGWGSPPGDALDPCSWKGVVCDEERHVTSIHVSNLAPASNSSAGSAAGPPLELLPELARLPRLQFLELRRYAGPPWAAIPPAWLARGAFPSLEMLMLEGRTLLSPLPDSVEPGALPMLRRLQLAFPELLSTLPPGWGAGSHVLPSLHELSLFVRVQGGLPPQWASGFRLLTLLDISTPTEVAPSRAAATLAAAGAARIPAGWAAGFGKLELLRLVSVDLAGPFPEALVAGGSFPELAQLTLAACGLTGTLPPQLLSGHPLLHTVWLRNNSLTGTLPAEWGFAQLTFLSVPGNRLTGPAFPPAWLEPGALPRLEAYDIAGNAGLTGTLPATPPPKMTILRVQDTGMSGSIPAAWCGQLIHREIARLSWFPPFEGTALPSCAPSAEAPAAPAARRPAAAVALGLALALLVVAGAAGRVALRRRAERRLQRSLAAAEEGLLLPVRSAASSLRDVQAELASTTGGASSGSGTGASSGSGAGMALRAVGLKKGQLPPRLAQLLHAVCRENAPGSGGTRRGPDAHWHLASSGRRGGPPMLLEPITSKGLRFVLADDKPIMLGTTPTAAVVLGSLHGKPVAIKLQELPPGVDSRRLWGEARMMQRCAHERVVPLLAVGVQDGAVLHVMECMEGGSLRRALVTPGVRERLRWEAGGRQVAIDVAEGLHFLHSQAGVQHNDLKSSNVLLTADLRACISDLGTSQLAASASRSAIGFTMAYAAPEQLFGRCTTAADLFAFGVLLIEIITQTNVTRRGEWRLPRAPDECSREVLDLIAECLEIEPQQRPTAAAALQRLRADAGGGDARLRERRDST